MGKEGCGKEYLVHTWSMGFIFDALRRAPIVVQAAALLVMPVATAPERASNLPAEAILSILLELRVETINS